MFLRRKTSSFFAASLLATCALFASGCAANLARTRGHLRAWAVSDMETVFPESSPSLENEVYSESAGTIRLHAAINETAAFQLVLAAEGAPAVVSAVRVDDFKLGDEVISAEHVRTYREGRITVNSYPSWWLRLTPDTQQTRQYPDQLIPLNAPAGALPITVEPGRCEAIWIDVHVPATARPGSYGSALHVQSSGGPRDLRISLEVWPFAIPQSRHLAVLAGLHTQTLFRQHLEVKGQPYAPIRLATDDPQYRSAVATLDSAARLLHEQRCGPMLRDVHPVRRMGANGQLEVDWSDYDRLVSGIIDGTAFEDRAAAPAWPMPIDDRDPAPQAYGGWGSTSYDRMLIEYLRSCVDHFQQRGWLNRHFVWVPLSNVPEGERHKPFEHLGRVMRQADTRLRLVCNLTPGPMASFGWRNDPFKDLREYVGIWCPPASLLDPEALGQELRAGKTGWLWPDEPPYSPSLAIFAPAVHARALAWQAYRYGLNGILLEAVNEELQDLPRAGGGEQALIWPGKAFGLDGPIPSIRLKRLRRGAQDYEYLWLLEHNRRPGIARLVAEDLFAYGGAEAYGEHLLDGRANGWVNDGAAWALARRLMARELAAAMSDDASEIPENVSAFAEQIDWARLTQGVHGVRGYVEGVRLQLDTANKSAPLRVAATVSVFNGTRRPISGRPAIVDMPHGWSAPEPAAPIENLPPLRTARRILHAFAPALNSNNDGVTELRLTLAGDVATLPARLCAITAQHLESPVIVDGKLNDWPLGINNVAGDFLLVGALESPKRNRASPDRASLTTLVFAAHDGEHLYIAFNCRDDQLRERPATRTNTIRYDGLWPTGEDCLEILIDPTGQAVDAGGLLHIVVKANGAVISERGSACMERVAPRSDWVGGVTAAIDDQSQPDRWAAEVRIPLKSLGKLAPIWGINFARYNARLAEYSCWTAARSHLYSPVTLGNIQLGR